MPFDDNEFDTVILDDVLGDAKDPVAALREAKRLVKTGGRVLLLASVRGADVSGGVAAVARAGLAPTWQTMPHLHRLICGRVDWILMRWL